MSRDKTVKEGKRLVWRISATCPAGAFVTASGRNTDAAPPVEPYARGRLASSLELSTGADVQEVDMNTLPDDLIDAFTKPPRP